MQPFSNALLALVFSWPLGLTAAWVACAILGLACCLRWPWIRVAAFAFLLAAVGWASISGIGWPRPTQLGFPKSVLLYWTGSQQAGHIWLLVRPQSQAGGNPLYLVAPWSKPGETSLKKAQQAAHGRPVIISPKGVGGEGGKGKGKNGKKGKASGEGNALNGKPGGGHNAISHGLPGAWAADPAPWPSLAPKESR